MDWKTFQSPPAPYREIPFWSWNDRLEEAELRRQIDEMQRAGWGGFFIHARGGLRTPYMGPRWLECVRACVEEARARGMGAWLYDEDRWPSGFAGGLSVAAHPEYRARALFCKVDDRPALLDERIAAFAAREVAGELADWRPDPAPALRDEADRLVQFYVQPMPLGDPRFNDYTYLDLLSPAAVRAFLDATHEVYARELGADFGQVVPGIFTDEPCYLFHGERWPGKQPAIPWTAGFLEYFLERAGYDLVPHLPSLFFDTGEFYHVRYDYWRAVTQRFLEAYTRQVAAWCAAHGLAYTGHYMAEDSLRDQVRWIGAAMPHYYYQHIPGIDKLERGVGGRYGSVLTVKQVDSAACQAGKKRTLGENYGYTGQDFAHTGRKWIGDWAYVLGVNLNNPHLALYSMRGERKRDYPANLFFQQPWWPENALVADYFARLSYALSQGQRVVDILVIHPIATAWTLYRPGAARAVLELDATMNHLGMLLLGAQRDFHLADEMLLGMELAGEVETSAAGPRLRVGAMTYRLVIVPPGITLAANTAHLLRDFAAAGGPVLAVAPAPYLVDGQASITPALPQETRHVALASLPEALDELLPFDVRVPGRPAIWAHHRRDKGHHWYFLANTDLRNSGPTTVYLRGSGWLEAWDAATGQRREVPQQERDGLIRAELDFPPAGSHLLVLHPAKPAAAKAAPLLPPAGTEIPLGDRWALTPAGPNALTLDRVRVRIDEGRWSMPVDILRAHGFIAEAGPGTPFELAFHFEAAALPPAPLYLVLESPERLRITVNGQGLPGDDCGWWLDPAFRQVEIGEVVRRGRNEVILRGVLARDSELESLYLAGNFGVAGRRLQREGQHAGQLFDRYAPEFRLDELPTQAVARPGPDNLAVDLTAQGFPFFAGRATLRQQVELPSLPGPVWLELAGLRAAVAHVTVNGRHAGTAAWPPHRVEVTAHVRPGENEIAVELVGTLRNLLGPHHLAGGDRESTGPKSFRDRERWTEDYVLAPFGFEGVVVR